MPISLDHIRKRFFRRLNVVDGAFERHLICPSLSSRFEQYAFQEGLLSNLWQYWNLFCRDTIILSAQGALTSKGMLTISPFSGRTESEISFVSKQLSRQENIGSVKPLRGRYLEPTWGDVTSLNRISAGIGASNSSSLVSAFGSVDLISHLQICRNACAHLNPESIASVTAVRVRYDDTSLRHPSQMMYWSDPVTKDFAWKAWIDEMMLIADFAVI